MEQINFMPRGFVRLLTETAEGCMETRARDLAVLPNPDPAPGQSHALTFYDCGCGCRRQVFGDAAREDDGRLVFTVAADKRFIIPG
ncbi:MAG: hypothetical protein JW781_08350 [Deltaproteobacteria bacterium]|nr:hypothetical protein [Candidatus Anaeroferrophillacea bacterium]